MGAKSIIETVTGDLSEKRRWRALQQRAKTLSGDYRIAFDAISHYLLGTSGIETITPLEALVDLLEGAAADGRAVLDITGPDVAGFADELVYGEKNWRDQQRDTLNRTLAAKLGKAD